MFTMKQRLDVHNLPIAGQIAMGNIFFTYPQGNSAGFISVEIPKLFSDIKVTAALKK